MLTMCNLDPISIPQRARADQAPHFVYVACWPLGNNAATFETSCPPSDISVATMALSAHDLPLQGLPYDVRLELFSHMILPPFDGCQDYAGLWLSCRQFFEEADSAGRTRLQMYANCISRASEKADSEDAAGHSSGDDAADPSLEILVPASVCGRPIIVVKVPLLLPPQEHDWHLQEPPPTMCGTWLVRLLGTPGPDRDEYYAARDKRQECLKQEEMYKQRVERLLGSIGDLHNLYARVEIHIGANEDAANSIRDPLFDQRLCYLNHLHSVVLGKMLDVYLKSIREQSLCSGCRRDGCSL